MEGEGGAGAGEQQAHDMNYIHKHFRHARIDSSAAQRIIYKKKLEEKK